MNISQDDSNHASLYTDLFTELVRVEIELWNELDTQLNAEAGITLPQFQALAAIRNNGGQTRVQDISAEMSITVGASSKVVDRLERDGLAVRSANPDDRRSSLVSLSERGATALAVGDVAAEAHLRASLGGSLAVSAASRLLTEMTSLRAGARARATR
jgi:DNA-binding MarR family transcriptional regulator